MNLLLKIKKYIVKAVINAYSNVELLQRIIQQYYYFLDIAAVFH